MNLSNEKRFKISYEIILNEDIDYYDDFLPMLKKIRYDDIKIKLNGSTINKLIIFTFYDNEYPLKNEGRNEHLHYWNYTEIIPKFITFILH